MWVLKIKLIDDKCIWATRCKKFGIYDFQYPLGFYKSINGFNFASYHILDGDKKAIKEFLNDVKIDKRVIKIDCKNNLAISLVKELRSQGEFLAFKSLYNHSLFYLKPGINYPDGHEIWEIGAFNRKDVERVVKYFEKYYQTKVLLFKEIKMPEMFIPQIMPSLTNKQLSAIKSAFENGYYFFPRKTNLHKLAKMSKISRPTFEEHLRKAEIKIIPFLTENLNTLITKK